MNCPACGAEASKAILGPFPFRMCTDEGCSCVWGFWSGIAFWLADRLQPFDPEEPGWLIGLYTGSYFGALRKSLTIERE